MPLNCNIQQIFETNSHGNPLTQRCELRNGKLKKKNHYRRYHWIHAINTFSKYSEREGLHYETS